jgi:hypothetical protein
MFMKSALLAGAAVAAFSMGAACTAALADGYSSHVVEHQTSLERSAVVEHRTVVRRTIVKRPRIVEHKTIIEHPTVVERRTIVKQPIVEHTIVERAPIVDQRTIVVRRPVDVYDAEPPVVDAGPPPWAFDLDD